MLLPVVARIADRFGPIRAMTGGAFLGLCGNVTYALSDSVAGLFLGQALTAGLWACVGALGVSIAQSLYPEGVGTASGIYLGVIPLGSAIGGTIGGIGVATIGLPHVFFIPAGLTSLAIVAFVVLGNRAR
jgi:SET family sugar efflux transporter-like MFS transporter